MQSCLFFFFSFFLNQSQKTKTKWNIQNVIAVWLGNLKKGKRGDKGLCAIDVIEGEGWHSLDFKGLL